MSLFNESEDKMITAMDINDEPQQRSLKNFKFRVSVYGVLREIDKILVARNPYSDKYGLPGGAVELGEKITEALIREFKEETGLVIAVEELLNIYENFFTFEGQDAHNIIIVYEVRKVGGELLVTGNGDDTTEVSYMTREKLLDGNLQLIFENVISGLKI